MKNFFWLGVGIFAGIQIKKQLDKSPEAQAFLADATAKAKHFGEIASEAFLDRTAELTGVARVDKKNKTKKSTKPTAKKPAAAQPPAAE